MTVSPFGQAFLFSLARMLPKTWNTLRSRGALSALRVTILSWVRLCALGSEKSGRWKLFWVIVEDKGITGRYWAWIGPSGPFDSFGTVLSFFR